MTISKTPISAPTSRTTLSLSPNDIHIWLTKPDDQLQEHSADTDALLKHYENLLTEKELAKQQRYLFKNNRHDALLTRVFVRDLLSYYADVLPKDWEFSIGEKGKPELVNPLLPLRFNLSHTQGLIVCAVTLEDDIGIDAENTTRSNDLLAIAKRYFSERECSELFSLPNEHQRSRFFDYWTLKESYIKAWGLGLSIPLKDFSFNFTDRFKSFNITKAGSLQSAISVNFAYHREDNSQVWRNWLYYPSNEHRIAMSLRAKENNQSTDYQLRFFESVPLISMTEIIN
jgi:4'-phosphopantetheinyl transferase